MKKLILSITLFLLMGGVGQAGDEPVIDQPVVEIVTSEMVWFIFDDKVIDEPVVEEWK